MFTKPFATPRRMFALLALLCVWQPAHAAVVFTIEQQGADVVATGSGTLNLAALTSAGFVFNGPAVEPSRPFLLVGALGFLNEESFTAVSAPALGAGTVEMAANSGTGQRFGFTSDRVFVPNGYSGGSLAGTATWTGTTLASLGFTEGTYQFGWGSGGTADSISIRVGSAVPEPSAWGLAIAGVAGIAAVGRRWRLQQKAA